MWNLLVAGCASCASSTEPSTLITQCPRANCTCQSSFRIRMKREVKHRGQPRNAVMCAAPPMYLAIVFAVMSRYAGIKQDTHRYWMQVIHTQLSYRCVQRRPEPLQSHFDHHAHVLRKGAPVQQVGTSAQAYRSHLRCFNSMKKTQIYGASRSITFVEILTRVSGLARL